MYEDEANESFFEEQKEIVFNWHIEDPINNNEIERTWAISEYQNPSPPDTNSTQAEPEVIGDNIKEPTKDTSPVEDVSSPAFSDDDIPF